VRATTVRPKITVTADGRGVASHAGTRLLGDLADAAGLTAVFSDALVGLRQRRSCHDPGRVLVEVAVMLADGGEAISDLAVLRDQPGLFGSVASTATAWRVLDAVEPRCLIGCGQRVPSRGSGPGCCAPRPAGICRRAPRVAGTGPG
jgi:Transposase DDE domain group 1